MPEHHFTLTKFLKNSTPLRHGIGIVSCLYHVSSYFFLSFFQVSVFPQKKSYKKQTITVHILETYVLHI